MPTTLNNPYFNGEVLPASVDAFVAWVDVMGARATMMRSLPITANFIFKLHVTALEEKSQGIRLYPVMDGLYVVCQERARLRTFLSDVYVRLAILFNGSPNQHRFLVKSAVAFGGVIHGGDVPAHASNVFAQNAPYKASVLLGMPVVNAVETEPRAAPFGIAVHDSARPLLDPHERASSHVWWSWFRNQYHAEAQALRTALGEYFEWCDRRAGAIDYDRTRIAAHRKTAQEYFVDA